MKCLTWAAIQAAVATAALHSVSMNTASASETAVLLLDRTPLEDGVDPFSIAPQPAPALPPPTLPIQPPASPPPMPFRYFGTMTGYDGIALTYLMNGQTLLSVSAGDVLDGLYRVESVSADSVTLFHLLRKERTELSAFGVTGRP